MASFRRLISSRANGRLSRGPKTDSGKRRSSQNARVHGCRSRTFLPPVNKKDRREYDELRDAFFSTERPANPTEAVLVEQMFRTKWVLRNILHEQVRIHEHVVASHPPGYFGDRNDDFYTPAHVWLECLRTPGYKALLNHEYRQTNKFLRAVDQFLEARTRPAAKLEKTTNEPTLHNLYIPEIVAEPKPEILVPKTDRPQPKPRCRSRGAPRTAF